MYSCIQKVKQCLWGKKTAETYTVILNINIFLPTHWFLHNRAIQEGVLHSCAELLRV